MSPCRRALRRRCWRRCWTTSPVSAQTLWSLRQGPWKQMGEDIVRHSVRTQAPAEWADRAWPCDAGDATRTYMTKPLRLRVHRPTPSITSPIRRVIRPTREASGLSSHSGPPRSQAAPLPMFAASARIVFGVVLWTGSDMPRVVLLALIALGVAIGEEVREARNRRRPSSAVVDARST
jgi:hypothetical protein